MQRVGIDEAAKRLAELVDAAIGGEDVFIVMDDERVVQLVSVKQAGRRRVFGSAKGLITMSDDFDAPLEDFREYME